MSDKCHDCEHELEGDGGCEIPCNLCNENDGLKFILNHRDEFDVALLLQLCQPLNISISDLKKVKNHFKPKEVTKND